MAQKTTVNVSYYSDLSGTEIKGNDNPTFSFGWGGDDYRIDLTNPEADKFLKLLQPYLDAAQKVSKRSTGKSKARANTGTSNAAEIRQWALSNGLEVPQRGRVPQSVRDAFDAAN